MNRLVSLYVDSGTIHLSDTFADLYDKLIFNDYMYARITVLTCNNQYNYSHGLWWQMTTAENIPEWSLIISAKLIGSTVMMPSLIRFSPLLPCF